MCTWCERERDSSSASSNKLLQNTHTHLHVTQTYSHIHNCCILMFLQVCFTLVCVCVCYLGRGEVLSTCGGLTSGLNMDSSSIQHTQTHLGWVYLQVLRSLRNNHTVDYVHYVVIAVAKEETGDSLHSCCQSCSLLCEMKVNNLCLWPTLLSWLIKERPNCDIDLTAAFKWTLELFQLYGVITP